MHCLACCIASRQSRTPRRLPVHALKAAWWRLAAVMDVLAQVSHEFLASVTSEPGGCTPVSPAEMGALCESAAKQSPLKR